MTAPVTIRPLVAADAPRLAQCFERCYGDTYVTSTFYDPAAIAARLHAGELRSVVAVDGSSNAIVGHMGLSLRRAGALTADAGNTIVDPEYRNQRLAARLGAGLLDVSREIGLVGFHHYATTAHPIMQKLAAHGGGVETGIMLDYVPAGTHYRDLAEAAETGRAAAVIIYQPIARAPSRSVALPEPYEETLRAIYDRARLERTFLQPGTPRPPGNMRIDATLDANRGLLRLSVARPSADLAAQVTATAKDHDHEILQIDLALADRSCGAAVASLRTLGFFFCAVLPEYDDGDTLRLQRLPDASGGREYPDLVMEDARRLLTSIVSDRERVGSHAGAS